MNRLLQPKCRMGRQMRSVREYCAMACEALEAARREADAIQRADLEDVAAAFLLMAAFVCGSADTIH